LKGSTAALAKKSERSLLQVSEVGTRGRDDERDTVLWENREKILLHLR
jgi:hypothetical protein